MRRLTISPKLLDTSPSAAPCPLPPSRDESAELKLSSTETGLDPATLASSSRPEGSARRRGPPGTEILPLLPSAFSVPQLSEDAPAASAAFCAARRLRRAFLARRLLPLRRLAPCRWRISLPIFFADTKSGDGELAGGVLRAAAGGKECRACDSVGVRGQFAPTAAAAAAAAAAVRLECTPIPGLNPP